MSVFVQASAVAGCGLFARTDIPKGAIVASLERPRVITGASAVKKEEETLKRNGAPHDSLIYVSKSLAVVDDSIGHGQTIAWYMMNHHKRKANTKNRWLRDAKGIVSMEWLAARDIAAGSELFYDYGDPDPRWED